ncbi:uncharacterized protein Cht6 isoform X2 [Bemisia tabaci]|uniref:uncharacterized protein Cht6 isoform X2 n=1 Tax=Bemisia tabaci TaxID=7038 RepID=UPI003B280E00
MRWLQFLLILVWTTYIAPQNHSVRKRATADSEKKVVCYYTNWSVYRPGTAKFTPQNINPYLCTHLIYAFGGLDRENGLRPYDKYQDIEQGGYAKFTGLKTFNKKLKTLLAIGGWNEGSARFSPLVADEERRREFVKNVVKFLRVNHFDGLDLDWEYPSFRDGGKPKDRENYASLVQELREEFDNESAKTGRPRLLLTMAVPAGIEYINKGYDVEKLNRYLDFMNILSYDYHSAFEPAVNHHSPLYPLEEESEYNFDAQLSIDYTIKHYLKLGADREKLVLGIPTYGRSYTLFNKDANQLGAPADGPGEQGEATREKGYLAYYEICNGLKEDSGWKLEQPKPEAMGPYAYKGNQWVGYDDEDIVKLKAQYVNEKGLGGIMFWSIDNDDFRGQCHSRPYPLIEAGKEALYGSAGPSNNLISSFESKQATQAPSTTRKTKPRPKLTSTRTTAIAKTTTPSPQTTPEPPTTPDPGSDFKCKDEGFFPHPRDCKKYFWCLDSGPSNLGIVAHQFTCPSGLFFNKAADSCDYTRNVLCNKKSSSTEKTTSAASKVTTAPSKITGSRLTTTVTTTTTTTTKAPPVEEIEEEEEYADSAEEDPKAIKQLISLIKKLGGVAELEKQLNLESGHNSDVTTPAISRTLYNKVLNTATPRYQSKFRNGPGPQNEGLKPDLSAASRKEKPQYVTIRRERPSTEEPLDNEDEETEIEAQSPQYKTIERSKIVDDASEEPEEVQEVQTPKYSSIFRNRAPPSKESKPTYVTLQRNRNTQVAPSPVEEQIDEGPVLESTSPSATPKYVTLRRQRPQLLDPASDDQGETPDKKSKYEVSSTTTDVTDSTSTIKPRVKVSDPSSTMEVIIVTPEPVTPSRLPPPLKATLPPTSTSPSLPTSTTPTAATTPSNFFVPSTSTRVVTTIVQAATERQVVPVNKLEYFLAKHSSGIRNLPINSEIIHNDVQKLDAEIINKLKKSQPSHRPSFNESKPSEGTKYNGINFKRYNSPANRTKLAAKSPTDSTERDALFTPSPFRKSHNTTHFDNFLKMRHNSRYLSLNGTTPEPTAETARKFVPSRSRVFKTTPIPADDTSDNFSDSSTRRRTTPISPTSTTIADIKKRRVLLRGKPNSPELITPPTSLEPRSSTLPQDLQTQPAIHNTQSSVAYSKQEKIIADDKEGKIELNEGRNSLLYEDKKSSTTDGENKIPDRKSTPEYEYVTRSIKPKNLNDFSRALDPYTSPYTSTLEVTTFKPPQRGKIRAQDYLQKLADELGTEVEENQGELKTVYFDKDFYEGSSKPSIERYSHESPQLSKVKNAALYSTSSPVTRRTNPEENLDNGRIHSNVESEKGKVYRGSVRAHHLLQEDQNIEEEYIQATTKRGSHYAKAYSPGASSLSTRKPYAQISRDYASQESNIDSVVSTDAVRQSKEQKESDRKIVTLRGKIRYATDEEKPKKARGNVIHAEYFENQRFSFQPTTEPPPRPSLAYRGEVREAPNNYLLTNLNNGQLIHLQAPLLAHSLLADEKFFEDNQSILNENVDDSPVLIQSREISSHHYERQTSDKSELGNDNKILAESTPNSGNEIPTIRNRTQFRRPNSSILRTRSTVKPTTEAQESTTDFTRAPANKFFRRRKIQPEIQSSIQPQSTTPKDEETSTIRGRKIEFPRRVTSKPTNPERSIPESATIQFTNSSIDYEDTQADGGSVSNRIGSLEDRAQVDKISDLANVAVVAIHNLATVGPRIPAVLTTKIEKVPVRQLIVTQSPVTQPPIVVAPVKKYTHRGNIKPYLRITTPAPASIPAAAPPFKLQDPLFDYDSEYYAEPVDVPLSGKVRIHNDGYIECLDVGNFPHPFSCRKFISCAKMENDNLLGWEYTCPRGLSFDPIGGMCNWSAGLGCKE